MALLGLFIKHTSLCGGTFSIWENAPSQNPFGRDYYVNHEPGEKHLHGQLQNVRLDGISNVFWVLFKA